MQKRLMLLVLSVFSCFMLLSGCASASKTGSETLAYHKDTVMQSGNFFARSWAEGGLADLVKERLDNKSKKLILPMVENLDNVKEEVGSFKSVDEASANIVEGKDFVKFEEMIEFEGGLVKFVATFDENSVDSGYLPSSLSAERKVTMAQKLEKAGINTIFGMAFIFIVLVFISFVIRALSLVPKFLAKKEKAEGQAEQIQTVAEPITGVQTEDISGAELTAVMMAAIMAYTADNAEVPSDGLVVRSIRRKGNGSWKNA
ncbi:MAG: OadG family protein [Catonella sp.]|uniref:OadG family protein n=1 Tax=Catonella sp. TaxID=2382125 RepID=UPI003FA06627